MSHESKFRIYSHGIVAAPKELNSAIIQVLPVEIVPFFDGEVKTDPLNVKDEGVDKNGKSYAIEIASDNTIPAEWLGIGESNRETPPDVRRGERVIIYRYDQNDKFYWTSMGLDKGLRRLETVIERYSAHTDEKVTELDDTNSYSLEISTHKGTITLLTSKKNNEKVIYGIQINPMDGTITIKDDLGNHIFLDSTEHLIEMENVDKSRLRLDKKTALLETVDSITLHSKNIIVKGDETVAVTTKAHTLDADTSKFTLKSLVVKATTALIQAVTTIKGNLTQNGNFASSGGDFTHGGHDVGKDHKHKATKPGSPTEMSGPPV
jgi:phage baseplate assembly protein gpV